LVLRAGENYNILYFSRTEKKSLEVKSKPYFKSV
jgi:hypothetical protein